jgi:hypothetical protein
VEKASNETNPKSATEASNDDTRRAAMAKIALYAGYTAPIMLGMMTSAKAGVVASGGPNTFPD